MAIKGTQFSTGRLQVMSKERSNRFRSESWIRLRCSDRGEAVSSDIFLPERCAAYRICGFSHRTALSLEPHSHTPARIRRRAVRARRRLQSGRASSYRRTNQTREDGSWSEICPIKSYNRVEAPPHESNGNFPPQSWRQTAAVTNSVNGCARGSAVIQWYSQNSQKAGITVSDVSNSQWERCSRCLCGALALKQGDLRALCLPLGGGGRPQTQIWNQ
ncbi:hypothetical protein L3Q82_013278, partial [Scortum barcoo]